MKHLHSFFEILQGEFIYCYLLFNPGSQRVIKEVLDGVFQLLCLELAWGEGGRRELSYEKGQGC